MIVTFDCYGTLIDWERGILDAFGAEAARDGRAFDPKELIAAYHAAEPQVEAGPFRPYREVLAETAMRVAAMLDWDLPADRLGFLAESLPGWPPFDDTNPALGRLARAGLRLGILSNVDVDLLAGTRRHLADVFDADLIVTAGQVGSYKPADGHFAEASRRIGDSEWVHAAQSHFHDVEPCSQRGIPVVWVNRKAEPVPSGGASPTAEVRDLTGLADLIERVSERFGK